MMLTQENHKLVKKIEGIHFRPAQIPGSLKTDHQSNLLGSNKVKGRKSTTQRLASLNYNVRKAENDRIYKENMVLFSKLKDSKPMI